MAVIVVTYYMAIGAIVLVCLSVYRKLRGSVRVSWSIGKPPEKKTWTSRTADFFLIPLGIVFIFVPLWPLILSIELHFPWHKLKFWTSKAARDEPWSLSGDEPEFSVRKEDLIEKLSRELVEEREVVRDPLGAVPALPFGHLNAAWTNFIEKIEPDCELWLFRRHWVTQYRNNVFEGYVTLQTDKIGPHFVSGERLLREPLLLG